MRNKNCTKCELHKNCKHVCLWGSPIYRLSPYRMFFIGEAPGQREDDWGLPFIGKAGILLNELMKEADIERVNVYVTNAVKCRPLSNRTPGEIEISACRSYLLDELNLHQPKVIVTLGKTAYSSLFPRAAKAFGTLASIRKDKSFKSFQDAQIVATYHPAAIFRNPGYRKDLLADLKLAKKLTLTLFLALLIAFQEPVYASRQPDIALKGSKCEDPGLKPNLKKACYQMEKVCAEIGCSVSVR